MAIAHDALPSSRPARPPRPRRPRILRLAPDLAAQAAGLQYVNDTEPGIRRRRAGRGFAYVDPNGRPLRSPDELRRFRSLAIPPAWKDVWICPSPHGHIQATGRDAKGRKQYRYHPAWQSVRDENKYGRLIAFGTALPKIRAQVAEDMAKPGLPREKVLATVVALLGETYIRIGNEEYARQNGSYGLTTLASDHVAIEGSTVRFRFRGKSGKEHDVRLKDRRVAAVLRRCQSLPGQALFQYLDDDKVLRSIGSHDVNEYLREMTGTDFTAKDFRTWGGTVIAAQVLAAEEPPTSDTAAKRTIAAAIKQVAARLGNTPAVCRKAYVHPAVLEAYTDGQLARCWDAFRNWHEESEGLSHDERAMMRLLRIAQRAAAQG